MHRCRYAQERFRELDKVFNKEGELANEREEAIYTELESLTQEAAIWLKDPGGYGGTDFANWVNEALERKPTDAEVDSFVRAIAGKEKKASMMGVKFATANASVSGMPGSLTIKEIEQLFDKITQGFKNAPLHKVVDKVSDLPYSAPADAKGAYWGGTVWLVRSNIAGAQDARETIIHEMIGHYGLSGFFGNALDLVLDELHRANPKLQRLAQDWQNANQALIADWKKQYGITAQQVKLRSVEEALAGIAQRGESLKGWRRLAAVLQTLLRKLGAWKLADSLEAKTDAEALLALKKAKMFAQKGHSSKGTTPFRQALYPLFAQNAEEAKPSQQFSEALRPPKNPSTVKEVVDSLMKLFNNPSQFNSKVKVVSSEAHTPLGEDVSENRKRRQGWVDDDGSVWLVAENIEKGQELAVFLHEIAGHLGMKNLLGEKNYNELVSLVKKWAAGSGRIEHALAKAAVARAKLSSSTDKQSEIIAYFLEEAVKQGVYPTAVKNAGLPVTQWFRKFWAAAKVALRKIGLGRIDNLTPQNIVDLAFGAARLELAGRWHGTAAHRMNANGKLIEGFRNFSNKYMSTGEGTQFEGEGVYTAELRAVGDAYMLDDLDRKHVHDHRVGFLPEAKTLIGKHWTLDRRWPVIIDKDDSIHIYDGRIYVTGEHHGGHYPIADLVNADGTKLLTDEQYATIEQALSADPIQLKGSLMLNDVFVNDDELLAWKKPFSEQSESVQKGVLNAWAEAAGHLSDFDPERMGVNDYTPSTGEEIYRFLTMFSDTARATSDLLDKHGVKGVLYPDGYSRIPGVKPTYNRVIFNDKNIQRVVTYQGGDKGRVKFSQQNARTDGKQLTEEEIIATVTAAMDEIHRMFGDTVKVDFKTAFGDNRPGEWEPKAEKNIIWLALNGDVLSTTFHESIHEFFDMLKKHGNEKTRDILERVAAAPVLNRRIERLLSVTETA